jgi:hypothetical protein
MCDSLGYRLHNLRAFILFSWNLIVSSTLSLLFLNSPKKREKLPPASVHLHLFIFLAIYSHHLRFTPWLVISAGWYIVFIPPNHLLRGSADHGVLYGP